ncbi:MAG: VCBS repeat-containing protein [Kofleriaceae bacterium]
MRDHGAGGDDGGGGSGGGSGSGSNTGANDSCGGLSRPWLATGQGPNGIVSGDFDRDGVIDLAVNSGTLGVLRGLGGGRFARKVDYPSSYSSGLAVADFDHDGKLDLVTSAAILRGNDDGSFQSGVALPLHYAAVVATGDFDGDGNADVVGAGDTLSLARGHGDGTFLPIVTYPADATAVAIVAVDLNRDGKLDVVVGAAGYVDVFLGHGDGTFDGKLSYPLSTTGYIAIGDVSGDGIADLVVPGPMTMVMPGMGNGSFGTAHVLATQHLNGSQHVALIDVDQDGTLDIVVGDNATSEIIPSHGDGTYGVQSVLYDEPAMPRAWVATDLDGDGQPDLAFAGYGAAAAGVLFGDHGTFVAPPQYATAAGAAAIALVDTNGDQHLDAVVLAHTAATVSILAGAGDGTFGTKRDAASGGSPDAFAVADFDGDGRPDVVTDGLDVLRGKGDGTLMPAQSFPAGFGTALATADFTSDGKPDVVVQQGPTLKIVTNAGDGTFPTAATLVAQLDPYVSSYAMTAADLDGNGTPDLAVVSTMCPTYYDSPLPSLRSFAGNGAGGFQALDALSLAYCATSLAAADLDHDGKLDLVVTELIPPPYNTLSPVEVFRGTGGGHVKLSGRYLADVSPAHVAIADVDGDGTPDLVVAGGSTEILYGLGDGTFGPRTPYGGPSLSIAAGDIDGDGSTDLVATSTIGFRVLRGTCH